MVVLCRFGDRLTFMSDKNDAEVVRITELLKTAIRMSGASNREVERRLGLSAGYLSRLFAGGIELKVKHVLDISDVIQLDPGEFFQLVFPGHRELTSPTGKKLLDLVSRIQGQEPPQPAAPLTSQQIEDLIRGALRKVFAELGRPA